MGLLVFKMGLIPNSHTPGCATLFYEKNARENIDLETVAVNKLGIAWSRSDRLLPGLVHLHVVF